MNDLDLTPFSPGALALRFRIEFRAGYVAHAWRPIVTGLQVVEVTKQEGDFVTWTNHLRARANQSPPRPFFHLSHRRELIALAWLETLSAVPAENPPVPITGQAPSAQESGAAESI